MRGRETVWIWFQYIRMSIMLFPNLKFRLTRQRRLVLTSLLKPLPLYMILSNKKREKT